MKRELASVLCDGLCSLEGKRSPFQKIVAYNMDGSGWDKNIYELQDLLDRERYVLYDVRFTTEGMELDVWFTTVDPS